ncbi:MAG TPA: SpaA isopeptide-forming pilin-related protein, partial [Thermomicrobiales bacterium]
MSTQRQRYAVVLPPGTLWVFGGPGGPNVMRPAGPIRGKLLHLVRFGGLAAIALLVLTACYTEVGVQTTPTAGSLAAATNGPPTQAPPKPPTQGGGGNQQQPPKSGGGGGGGGSPAAGAKTPTRAVLRGSPATTGSRTPVAPPTGSKTPTRPGTMPAAPGTKAPPVRTVPPVTTGTARTTQGVTQPAGGTKPAGTTPRPGVTVSTTAGSPTASPTETTGSPAATGMLVITKHENFQNAIVAGACFALLSGNTTVASACDGGDGDGNADPGTIAIAAPPGAYTLHETTPPAGYMPAEDTTVEITAGASTAIDVIDHLEVTTSASPSTTTETGASPSVTTNGGLFATIATEDGSVPPAGTCLMLTGPATYQACDTADGGDADPTTGSIEIDNVPPGDYTLTVTPPAGYELVDAPASVTVSAGTFAPVTVTLRAAATPPTGGSPTTEETATETPTEEVTTAASPSAVGYVLATITDEGGANPVGGACLHLTGPATYDACDDQQGDADSTPGTIEIDGVATGDYTVTVDAPSGYEPTGEQPNAVHVDADQGSQLTFPFRLVATTGMVRIDKFDGDGTTPLGGACFDLTGDNGSYQVCDDGDGDADELVGPDAAPGVIVIANVAAGDYTLHESQTPAGHDPGPDQSVHVDAGQTAPVSVVNGTPTAPQTGTLVITKVVAAEGTPAVGGACFSVTVVGSDGTPSEQCDDDGDGVVRFENLAPGDYTVHESRAPENYQAAEDQQATVTAGAETPLTFVDQPVPQTGTLTVDTINPEGTPIPGACYSATGPDNGAVQGCDDDNDGTVPLGDVAAGDWQVQQTTAPAGYALADPATQTVTVAAGQPAQVSFTNQPSAPETGSIAITVQDDQNQPVPGAC